jgi:hypothetical protein
LLRLLWPNSWRSGILGLSNYLRGNASTAICVSSFGLATTAEYGLSVQVIGIAMGLGAVWTWVKWPEAGQLRAAGRLHELRVMLQPRMWLQLGTYAVLAGAAVAAGPWFLHLLRTDKHMLPVRLLALLSFASLIDLQFIFWGTLLTIENRIPTFWSNVVTNIFSLGLALLLVHQTSLGVAALVVAPFVTGLAFNYWYWPAAGARSLGTTWRQFVFSRLKGGT